MKISLSGIWKDRLTTIIGLVFVADVVRRYTTGEVSLSELALNLDTAIQAGEALFGTVMMLLHRKKKDIPKTTGMEDFNGYRYLGDNEQIEGYKTNWEYPELYIQSPNINTTEDLAEFNPALFEPIATVFPDPNRPNPPRKEVG